MIVKDVGLPPFTRNLIMTCGWGAASRECPTCQTDNSVAAFFISVFSLASYATDGLGLSQTQAAALQSVLSVGLTLGRPLWGALSDRFGRLYVPAICYLIAGLSTFAIWLPARSFGVLVAFACVQGLVAGVVWSTATPVLASAVEYRQLEGGLTVFWTAMTLPSLFAQPIAISLIDMSKNRLGRTGAAAYSISIVLCGGMCLASAGMLYLVKRSLQKQKKSAL
jgi:MFS family permease